MNAGTVWKYALKLGNSAAMITNGGLFAGGGISTMAATGNWVNPASWARVASQTLAFPAAFFMTPGNPVRNWVEDNVTSKWRMRPQDNPQKRSEVHASALQSTLFTIAQAGLLTYALGTGNTEMAIASGASLGLNSAEAIRVSNDTKRFEYSPAELISIEKGITQNVPPVSNPLSFTPYNVGVNHPDENRTGIEPDTHQEQPKL